MQYATSSPQGPAYLIASREALEEEMDPRSGEAQVAHLNCAERNAPVEEIGLSPPALEILTSALLAAERAGRLRLHVRVDERSAGFLALGLAKGSLRPVPVVTTSGTAVANLHPAVLEASHAGVPLVVLSADRPHELRGSGANQTTTQPGIFAGAVRFAFIESDA